MANAKFSPKPLALFNDSSNLHYAIAFTEAVVQYAGDPGFLDDDVASLRESGIIAAVECRNTPRLYDWLMRSLSFQGVSDAAASSYMERNGNATHRRLTRDIASSPPCPKLASYGHFQGCGYRKSACHCAEPSRLQLCPLPRLPLRNGRLNQTAYSLFFFVRDVAEDDLVEWIDRKLEEADVPTADRLARMRNAVIGPLTQIYGVSDKVLNMTLATLFLCVLSRPRWQEVGASMIAIDTLVHNFLHRSGITHRLGAPHFYGPACYANGGCAGILEQIATAIDARRFNAKFPRYFPRFIQHAVWRFCAQTGLATCNGNRIDDRRKCGVTYCRFYGGCDRRPLAS